MKQAVICTISTLLFAFYKKKKEVIPVQTSKIYLCCFSYSCIPVFQEN